MRNYCIGYVSRKKVGVTFGSPFWAKRPQDGGEDGQIQSAGTHCWMWRSNWLKVNHHIKFAPFLCVICSIIFEKKMLDGG